MEEDVIEFTEDYKIVKGKTIEELTKAVKAELNKEFEPMETPVFKYETPEGVFYCKEMVKIGEEEIK